VSSTAIPPSRTACQLLFDIRWLLPTIKRPSQGIVGMNSQLEFGHSGGIAEGVAAALDPTLILVAGQTEMLRGELVRVTLVLRVLSDALAPSRHRHPIRQDC
jgi:hypothetical protein